MVLAAPTSYVKSVSDTRLTAEEIVTVPADVKLDLVIAREAKEQVAVDVVPEVPVIPKLRDDDTAVGAPTSKTMSFEVHVTDMAEAPADANDAPDNESRNTLSRAWNAPIFTLTFGKVSTSVPEAPSRLTLPAPTATPSF